MKRRQHTLFIIGTTRLLYREIYDKDPFWYEDCLGDLFEFLKGKERDWNKLRTFEWRSKFGPWLSTTARHRFIEIKPYLIGKIENPLSIDVTDGEKTPVQLPEKSGEEYERLERKIILMEAVGMLKDPDQKCRSEYNADRAGLICCKDIETVKHLFMKIGMIESITVFHQYKETSDDHPMLTTCLKELYDFATSI